MNDSCRWQFGRAHRLPLIFPTQGMTAMLSTSMDWSNKNSSRTYYVAGDGNDRNLGTHPTMAWATIDRVNKHRRRFKNGDRILFKRGFTYAGVLFIDSARHARKQISIGAYGSGFYPIFQSQDRISK